MRWIVIAVTLGAQAAALPPPYPRQGTTKILDNDRVQVWDIAWLRQTHTDEGVAGSSASTSSRSNDRRPADQPATGYFMALSMK